MEPAQSSNNALILYETQEHSNEYIDVIDYIDNEKKEGEANGRTKFVDSYSSENSKTITQQIGLNYAQLHRSNFKTNTNSSVSKIKGRFESIAKQENKNINVEHHVKTNIDNVLSYQKQTKSGEQIANDEENKTENLSRKFPLATLSSPKPPPKPSRLLKKPILRPNVKEGLITTTLTEETIEQLKIKYSPASFGYPKTNVILKSPKKVQFSSNSPTRLPLPTPRHFVIVEDLQPPEEVKIVETKLISVTEFPPPETVKPSEKQPVEHSAPLVEPEEVQLSDDIVKEESEESSDKTISDTEDMEKKPKEKKRSNSFRRIAGFFTSKDKKKDEKKKKDGGVVSENTQNETHNFDRGSTHRHTLEGFPRRDVYLHNVYLNHEPTNNLHNGRHADYANNPYPEMKREGNNMFLSNRSKNSSDYVPMDNGSAKKKPYPHSPFIHVNKYMDTSSSSSNTLESDTYQNALIAQAELKQIRDNENLRRPQPIKRRTPTNVELIKPKAVIPINSERPLPNPYCNTDESEPEKLDGRKTLDRNLNRDDKKHTPKKEPLYKHNDDSQVNKPVVEDIYGTVYDSISGRPPEESRSRSSIASTDSVNSSRRISASPRSLEGSKLRLPSNREKIELQPRIRSPIPPTKVSTEKIIATELLRNALPPDKCRSPDDGSLKKSNQRPSPNSLTKNALDSPRRAESPQRLADYAYVNNSLVHSPCENNADNSLNRIKEGSPMQRRSTRDIPYYMNDLRISQEREQSVQERNYFQYPESPAREIYKPLSQSTPEAGNNKDSSSDYYFPDNYAEIGRRSKLPKRVSPQSSGNSLITNQQRQSSPIKNFNEESPIYESRKHLDNCHLDVVSRRINNSTKGKPPISPRVASPVECLQAAEWQRAQKDLDQSSPMVSPNHNSHNQQIVTNAQVHTNPQMQQEQYYSSERRPHTPVQKITTPTPSSPQKQHMLQNVEAFYWRELKKLKDKEEQDLMNYRQVQLSVYGYLEDPVNTRRARSASPSVNRGRRSLSLPRESRPVVRETRASEPIPEGRPTPHKPLVNVPYATANRNPNFIRNSFERSTVGPIGVSRMNACDKVYAPIVKRDSFAGEVPVNEAPAKKVSFTGSQNRENVWPTKNGFTKSPPTRRVERHASIDDDVFLSHAQKNHHEDVYVSRRTMPEPLYDSKGRRVDPIYESRVANPLYDVYSDRGDVFYAPRVYTNPNHREPQYVRRPPADYVDHRDIVSDPYKRITMRDKVCDIYGQIHEPIQRSGVIYGCLQNPATGSPLMSHPGQNTMAAAPPAHFVRGGRLTSSVNDMYRRYPQQQQCSQPPPRQEPPTRPLPPIPRTHAKNQRVMYVPVPISDIESGSEEVQRIFARHPQQCQRKNFGSVTEEEWNSEGKSGRGASGSESGGRGDDGEVKGRSRSARREDPRRHTLAGDQHYGMAGQGGPLSRTMDLEGQFKGYPPPSNAMLFDDDPGIMSEVETSSTGFRRGGKQRSSLPVVRTPSKTLERPLGLVFLQYRNETKRALLPNEITSIDTVKALFVRSFPKQLTMEYLDSPMVKIYIHDSSKDMFYELEDVRSHLREIRDRSVLRLFESTDVSGGLPMGGVGIPGGIGHFEDPSYFSEPEFDSEYQHQHIHKSKGSTNKGAPYYMGSTTSLPRSGPLLRPYSPAVGALPPERLKTVPAGAPPKPQRAYSSGARNSEGHPDRFAPFQRPSNPLFGLPDGYMSSPERGSRGYEDPYYSQYTSRSGSITPVIDEEVSDTELLDEQYSLYGVKMQPSGAARGPRSQFPGTVAPPYDPTRIRVENMERQLANLTGLVQKALTQTPTPRDFLQPPGRDPYRPGDEFDMNSSSSSASLPDESFLRSDSKTPKLGKSSCHKSVSFEKSVSFSDEPPDMNSPKQHSPQHAADSKPPKPAIKSSTLPRTSSQEKDRLKPAPPPKPASLSPGQYDGRNIYRDLQLTPEMYNQLRGLQKKAKDLRAEVRNLRRMSQAQAHSVRETIRDTFIKIRAMLMAGGEQVWQAGMDQERVRLSREEDLYKQEMLRLENDLTDLESSVEQLRGNVINRKTRVNMSDVENMALVLSKSSKTVADLKLRFPGLQDSMKSFLTSEMDKVVREEKFLKEEPERLESALRRCKKLTGTLVTLKRLASVQEQRLPCAPNANDGNISPTLTETPPVTPTTGQHSKSPTSGRVGQVGLGGEPTTDYSQRPENALDALLDELQTFSRPAPTTTSTGVDTPPALPTKVALADVGRKGSVDSATHAAHTLTVSTGASPGNLRRLHSYPSGSDTDNSPPIHPVRQDGRNLAKPPLPERNTELLQHLSGRRVPPPPPPRTSSKSPLASPTSPSLPPRAPLTDKPMSQFEAATQNLGLSTLRRNIPRPNNNNKEVNTKSQTLPRNIGSNLQVHQPVVNELQNVSSSSCESVNSQDGSKKGSRKEELEQRHQELLKKQKALQEQYARLQQIQRGSNTLAVIPPAPDQLLKKTGSESNLLQKMGLQMATAQMTGSLTHLPGSNNTAPTSTVTPQATAVTEIVPESSSTCNNIVTTTTTTNKVYETDIL